MSDLSGFEHYLWRQMHRFKHQGTVTHKVIICSQQLLVNAKTNKKGMLEYHSEGSL